MNAGPLHTMFLGGKENNEQNRTDLRRGGKNRPVQKRFRRRHRRCGGQLVGFGSFEVKARSARMGRNPHTKEPIEIPASRIPVFKAGKALKDTVAG